jgi:hypothetical protein
LILTLIFLGPSLPKSCQRARITRLTLTRSKHLILQVVENTLADFDPCHWIRDALVAVVVVLVPVAVRVPAVFVFVPPLVTFTPAPLPSLVQFTTLVVCLPAVASMLLDGLVKFMIGMSHPALTPVIVFGVKAGDRSEEQSRRQCGSRKQGRCCA